MLQTEARIIVVTGAASGIGKATTRRLVDDGCRVAAIDLDFSLLDQEWAETPEVTSFAADVRDRAGVEAAVTGIIDTVGVPVGLVNCAGIYRPAQALDITDSDFADMFAVNVMGTFIASQVVARFMAGSGGGAIVNISSVAGSESTDENVAYSATKGAVEALTRGFAVSLAPHYIRVNAVAPGPIATPMGLAAAADPAYEERILRRVLARRFAEPQDVAHAIVFLLDENSQYITGHVLHVDGGVLAHR